MGSRDNLQYQVALKKIDAFLKRVDFPIREHLQIVDLQYKAIKIASVRLNEKRKRILPSKKRKSNKAVILSQKEVANCFALSQYFHENSRFIELSANPDLCCCFGKNFREKHALDYFEKNLESKYITDKHKQEIHIPADFYKSLYKDPAGYHVVNTEYYKSVRGKRLPMIRHSVEETTNVYTRTYMRGKDNIQERMYIYSYKDSQYSDGCFYYAVIAHRPIKSKEEHFTAKTAFPILTYNGVLSRVAKYKPAKK